MVTITIVVIEYITLAFVWSSYIGLHRFTLLVTRILQYPIFGEKNRYSLIDFFQCVYAVVRVFHFSYLPIFFLSLTVVYRH